MINPIYKLPKPLYHGTTADASIYITSGYGLNSPIYLTEDKRRAIHYAKAAAAYVEDLVKEHKGRLLKEGYAVFTFSSLPNKEYLVRDEYNVEAEPDQWIYQKTIRGLRHFTVEHYPLIANKEERMRLKSFAIGMWMRNPLRLKNIHQGGKVMNPRRLGRRTRKSLPIVPLAVIGGFIYWLSKR